MMKSFKRGFSTLTCIDAELSAVLSYAVNHRFSAVELRLDSQQSICGMGIADAPAIRTVFSDAGIVISDLAAGVTLTGEDDAPVSVGCGCIDLAAAVNAAGVRVFIGKGVPHFSDQPKHDFDGIVDQLRMLCAYAAEKNIQIWAETHSEFSSGKEMRRLVDAVRADGVSGTNLRVIWDVIHTLEYKETPAESIGYLGEDIVHVHLKDGIRNPDDAERTQFIHKRLGEGEMPVHEVLALLSETAFDGVLSLEWEAPWRPELKDVYPDVDAIFDAYNSWLDAAETDSAESTDTPGEAPVQEAEEQSSAESADGQTQTQKSQRSRKTGLLIGIGASLLAVTAVTATLLLGRKSGKNHRK